MVGVRPTKLLHKYIDTYGSVHAATRHIRDEFCVYGKACDLGAIGEYQRPFYLIQTIKGKSLLWYSFLRYTLCVLLVSIWSLSGLY